MPFSLRGGYLLILAFLVCGGLGGGHEVGVQEDASNSLIIEEQVLLAQPPLFLVSFPRSGHTLVTKILEKVFDAHGVPFQYCENYINSAQRDAICGSHPNVIKSHDFDLTLQPAATSKYVVLYRNELKLQLEAVFRWLCSKKGCPKSMRTFMDNWYVTFPLLPPPRTLTPIALLAGTFTIACSRTSGLTRATLMDDVSRR